MLPPKLPVLHEEMLEDAVSQAMREDRDIEACHFFGDALPDAEEETLEFSGCHLKNVSSSQGEQTVWCLWTAYWKNVI